MKPVYVKFKCFGPYMDEQTVDFTALGKLFLICGETGAGKTTILDAISVALYWHSSGGTRGTLSDMRCQLAGKDDVTSVEFVFEVNGRRYKFTRSLIFRRKNFSEEHNSFVMENGVFVPLSANPTQTSVTRDAERIIGLNYEQFSQVMILPQGKFERLLVSNSGEKEKILCSLFHADRWAKACRNLSDHVAERDKELKNENAMMTAKLAEYGCESTALLAVKINAEREAIDALGKRLEQAKKDAAAKRAELEAAIAVNEKFDALDKARQAAEDLNARAEAQTKEDALLKKAEEAEKLTPVYEETRTTCIAFTEQEKKQHDAEAQAQKAKEKKERAQKARDAHTKGAQENEENKRRMTRLTDAQPAYLAVEEHRDSLRQAKRQAEATARDKAKADSEHEQRVQYQLDCSQKQKKANDEHARGLEIYLGGMSGKLAQELKENEPCPVCGSKSHPCPAQLERHHVTDEQYEQLKKRLALCNEMYDKADKARQDAEKVRSEAEKADTAAKERLAREQTALEMAQEKLIEGIDSIDALKKSIDALREKINAYEKNEKSTLEELDIARREEAAAQQRVQTAQEDTAKAKELFDSAKEKWNEALKNSVFDDKQHYLGCCMEPAQRQKRRDAFIRYESDRENAEKTLLEAEKKVEGVERPDIPTLKQSSGEAEKTVNDMAQEKAVRESGVSKMEKELSALADREEKYKTQRAKADADMEFARRLQGSTGVGLQRYVLGVMLSSITVQANQLLESIYDGRYRLYRSDEASGSAKKLGLELAVLDKQTGEKRSVTTLSGGEKFLVALSLAIGLSTVVQAQGSGIKMEAMFVDEGFGSLDKDSVDDALDVLSSVNTAGTVGIISHVERLEETIPSRIEVRKGKNGSTLRTTEQ